MKRLTDPLTSAAILCLTASIVLLLALPPTPAHATKEYARTEGKDCSHCHINDKGSGPRNPTGREYEANGYKFGVESWSSDENKASYLRAKAAMMATWYAEASRLFDELEATEELPGGKALIEGNKRKFRMFPRTWKRSADKLLAKGTRGLPNALGFLCRLESQFPGTKEGKAAIEKLTELARDEKTKDAVAAARDLEQARIGYLKGRTALELGDYDEARPLLEAVLKDERLARFHEDAKLLLAETPDGR